MNHQPAEPNDPYRLCHRDTCEHDLVQGVLVHELLEHDGPHPSSRARLTGIEPSTELEAA